MNYVSIVTLAAKKVGVASSLLLAICTHESGLRNIHNENDKGSPSIGICQIKEASMKTIGFKGTRKDLENPQNNAFWAAKYLKMQLDRYNNDGCRAVAAYNSGSYNESKKKPGYPKNLHYVKSVQGLISNKMVSMLLECNAYNSKVASRFK